jgi:hypothetical protein
MSKTNDRYNEAEIFVLRLCTSMLREILCNIFTETSMNFATKLVSMINRFVPSGEAYGRQDTGW